MLTLRKRIWRLAEDQFDNEKQSLICEPAEIISEAATGTEITGSVLIRGNNKDKIRGIVYSTNPYVLCDNPKFDALSHEFTYRVKLLGTKVGESLEGSFVVVAGGVQVTIPYLFGFKEKEMESSQGMICNLNDYTELAKNHWQEALGLFFSNGFEGILQNESADTKLIYKGYRRGIASSKNLEEFLIAVGKKNRVHLEISEEKRVHESVREDVKNSINIRKSGWGYFEIKAESEGEFLSVEQPVTGSESFLGEEFKISYYIHKDRLHAGKNIGSVTLSSMGQTWKIVIEASSGSNAFKGTDRDQYRKRLVVKLYKDYTQYRLGNMPVALWAQEANKALNELRTMDEEHALFYQLIRGYAYALNGDIRKAEEIIAVLNDIVDDRGEERGFLMYIQYLLTADVQQKRQLADDIREMADPIQEQYMFDWILLQLQRDGGSERGYYYQAMYALQSTWNSPLFYIEMHEMLEKYPYLFTELNRLSLGFLSWMRKNHCFPKELVQQLARVTEGQRSFHPQVYRILCSCYVQHPSKELLGSIVKYLLTNQCMGEQFHFWYDLAIKEEITITGVYEAYLRSRSIEDRSPLPQLLTRFFVYSSHLSSERRALLYACVIENKNKDTNMYMTYQPMMDSFAKEMILQGRIDENLAIVFSDYLERNDIRSEIAVAMAPLLCVCKITCDDPNVVRGYMHQKQLEEPVMTTFYHGVAYLPVYAKDYVLLLETADHSFIKNDSMVAVKPLIDKDRWLYLLYANAPDAVGYMICDLSGKNPDAYEAPGSSPLDRKRKTAQMKTLLSSRYVSSEWKQEWLPKGVAFLKQEGEEEAINLFCDNETDLGKHSVYFRSYIIANWIWRKQYHRAFMCLRGYNGLEADPDAIERLLVHLITHNGLSWADDFAISLGAWLVTELKRPVQKELLEYLAVHYVGPTEAMVKIFRELQDEALDMNTELEERILVQQLYSETFSDNVSDIFDAYRRRRANRRISAAYLNYWSNEAIRGNSDVPEHIYHYIMEDMKQTSMTLSCQTALLLRFCQASHLTVEEAGTLEKLLSLAIDRNAYFKAYEKLPQVIKDKYQLYDKFFAEYRFASDRILYIQFEGDNKPSAMTEGYPGIYAASHVLFPGESVEYTISSEDGTILTSRTLSYQSPSEVNGEGAYEKLCDIAEEMRQGKFVSDEICEYVSEMYIAKEMFPIL